MKTVHPSRTRRDFLGLLAGGATAAATGALARPAAASVADDPKNTRARVTHTNKRFEPTPAPVFTGEQRGDLGTIRVDPDTRYQEILGFGAAFTDSSCYLLNQLDPQARRGLLNELFSPPAMGLSVCRTCVGASDYSRQVYSYDDEPGDLALRRFSIDYDRAYILPMLREARQVNPQLFLFSSAWSPPGWMKVYGTMLGGWMRAEYLECYARYYARYLEEYATAGAPIDALTPQNEVETDQGGKMPACVWHPELEMSFVRDHLGPLLEKKGMKTKIWIVDHDYNHWRRAKWMLDDPGVRKYAGGVAFHGYEGTPDMMTRLHQAHPQVDLFWTEGGPNFDSPEYTTEWCRWGKEFTGILRNWCRSITAWNLALDERGNPRIGPFTYGGLVTIHSATKAITHSGQSWALGHFSRVVRRGAVRIASDSTAAGIEHVAFSNPTGEIVLVVTNPGVARTVQIQYRGRYAPLDLPLDSMMTLVWE
jgi:glucosylceramidase